MLHSRKNKRNMYYIQGIFSALLLSSVKLGVDGFDPETLMNGYEYPLETHEVQTEDGYILTLHRVPYGRNSRTNTTRPPVLVMHGILCSSINFMFMGPEKSLIPMLADAGYDVWAGNNRGNTYSRKHVSLDPDTDDEFWNFSYHEMGYYDDTAMIDYILNATGTDQLFYVGYSQGTTQYFTMASTRSEYNDKIILMSAMAPVVHCNNLRQPLVRLLAANYLALDAATTLFNVEEVFPHSNELSAFCNTSVEVCILGAYAILGYDPDQINSSVISAFYQNFPEGTSIKAMKHLIQGTTYGVYTQYNYGVLGNLAHYYQRSPPVYDLSLVTSKIALYYSVNDWLSTTEDVDTLSGELSNLERKYLVENDKFTHGNYMYAVNVDEVVNSEVISFMNEYVST